MSNSLQPHGLWPARLLCPRDSPGKNTGVGCHALPPGNLPDPGIEPMSPAAPCIAGRFLTTEPPGEARLNCGKRGTLENCVLARAEGERLRKAHLEGAPSPRLGLTPTEGAVVQPPGWQSGSQHRPGQPAGSWWSQEALLQPGRAAASSPSHGHTGVGGSLPGVSF